MRRNGWSGMRNFPERRLGLREKILKCIFVNICLKEDSQQFPSSIVASKCISQYQ